jgi:serine phosphatase RsbU (regulator of sigma subunit)
MGYNTGFGRTNHVKSMYLMGRLGGRDLTIELRPGLQTLGRSSACEIHIEDSAISRKHAELRLDGERATVKDLGSMNGTFVNGARVEQETPFTFKDELRFGHIAFTVGDENPAADTHTPFAPDTAARATLTTSYEEIRKSPSERVLSIVAEAGQILQRRMDHDEMLEAMLDLIQRSIPASRILILGRDLTAGEPEVVKLRLIEGNPGEPLLMSQTMLRRILEEGKSLLTSDAGTGSDLPATKSMVAAGIHAALGAPLFDNDRILGAVYLDSRTRGTLYHAEQLRLLTLLANMLAVKITNHNLEMQEEQRREELAAAERIQRRLLPSVLPSISGYDIFAFQEPCQAVGGDLYDVRTLPDGRIWFVVGDVSGKGIGAALLMSSAMAGLQILASGSVDPLNLINRLEEHLEERIEYGQFITIFAGIFDPPSGRIEYVNAGHDGPVLLGPSGCEQLGATGGAVALVPREIRRNMPDLARWVEKRTLEPGHSLLVFSDGITETEYGDTAVPSYRGMQYGEVRMTSFLNEACALRGQALGEAFLADLDTFRGDHAPHDDVTLLVFSRPPAP